MIVSRLDPLKPALRSNLVLSSIVVLAPTVLTY